MITNRDDKELLQKAANEAFSAIKKNTGNDYHHATITFARESFALILRTRGIAWLIDSTSGTGMSHIALAWWLEKAKESEE